MHRVSVLTINPRLGPLDYLVAANASHEIGTIVEVPLGPRTIFGAIWTSAPDADVPATKLKTVLNLIDLPPLKPTLRQLIAWTADYYIAEAGAVLRMVLASGAGLREPTRKVDKPFPLPNANHAPPTLNMAQAQAVQVLGAVVKSATYAPILLDGVTGSGKTEVYFEAIAETLRQQQQSLILLPEIALTAPFLARFEARFACAPIIWHSGLTPAARRRAYRAIAQGEKSVVIGTRSAIFLPFARLGVIIVDEAHEASYKQEDGVPYHARDVAIMRARFESIPIILATATPPLETRAQVWRGAYQELKLPARFGAALLPTITALDLTKEAPPRGHWLAPTLVRAIDETLARAEQSLLFLNRRGFAPLTLCRTCGHRFNCPNCTAWMVEHRNIRRLQCHHCGHLMPPPRACPECGEEDSLVACGPGVERIGEEVAMLFPTARQVVATSDTFTSPAKVAAFVAQMNAGEIDIVIGTQLVTKGYHFPNLTLVGVIDADLGLQGGDLRAAERSFQQISQVAGRAGRADKPGQVYIQTYEPGAAVIRALVNNDSEGFYSAERAARESANAPPFGRFAAIIVSAEDNSGARTTAQQLGKSAPRARNIQVYGPAPAPLAKLLRRYRYRLLVHATRSADIQGFIRAWLGAQTVPRCVRVAIDVDPYSFV